MDNSCEVDVPVEHCALLQSVIPISIISNSCLMGEALILLLQGYQNIHLINTYPDNIVIAEAMTNPLNHVVLIDSGIGCERTVIHIQQWRRLVPPPYIVVLELQDDVDLILSCIEAGANGYTLQGASSLQVHQVILQACQGMAQCSPEVTAKLFSRLVDLQTMPRPQIQNPLTRREMEVLGLIAKGYSDRAIAFELIIEICTVKHHIHNLLRKLGVKHRWDAARLALDQGWIVLE